MSVIGKTPYVQTVLSSLTTEQLTRINTLLNTSSTFDTSSPTSLTDVGAIKALKISQGDAKLGINPFCSILASSIVTNVGILVYTNSYCTFFVFSNGCCGNVSAVDLHEGSLSYTTSSKGECCSVEEFKRTLFDLIVSGGGIGQLTPEEVAWVQTFATLEEYDEDTNTISVGTHLYTDGDITVDLSVKTDDICSNTQVGGSNVNLAEFDGGSGGDNHWHLTNVKFDDTVYVEYPHSFIDSFGDNLSLVPKPADSDLGKTVFLGTTGMLWGSITNTRIDSGNNESGKVLTADGSGGATWANAATTTVVDNVSSTSATDALSANQGRVLNNRIDNVEARGRFLSVWNASTGKPSDLPSNISSASYTYRTGDYFIVGTAGSKVPTGTSIPQGTTIETYNQSADGTSSIANDTIVYNNQTWTVIHTPVQSVTFGSIAGNATDNTSLANALNAKQNVIDSSNKLDYSLISNTPTVDQSYSASSSNAQSGVAVASAISGKQDVLPTVVNDRYLHTNSSTGALEWAEASGGVPVLELTTQQWQELSNNDATTLTSTQATIINAVSLGNSIIFPRTFSSTSNGAMTLMYIATNSSGKTFVAQPDIYSGGEVDQTKLFFDIEDLSLTKESEGFSLDSDFFETEDDVTVKPSGLVYNKIVNGTLTPQSNPYKIVVCTAAQYAALTTKDPDTQYNIVEE